MEDRIIILGLWLLALVASVPYVLRAKHHDQKPVAAIAIFAMLFTVVAFGIFAVFSAILVLSGAQDILELPTGIFLFLLIIFLPAFFVARWQIVKPPRKSPKL